jgi:beta-mannosidase
VGTSSWTYRIQFHAPSVSPQLKATLALDGLDTFAVVRLDGKVILRSDNMFISHRVDVTEALKSQREHHLEIDFDSALLKARQLEKCYPHHNWTCSNGESARLAARKAQYHWGWDWGPLLNCAGIWKPIRLEVYTAKIDEVRTDVVVAPDRKSATVKVSTKIETQDNYSLRANFKISFQGRAVLESSIPVEPGGIASANFRIDSPSLWMPAGYGSQNLYDVQVTLFSQKVELHSESCRIGLRHVKLVQEPDSHGKSFYFRINGVDIFCGGSCWIPAHSFLTNVTPQRYRAWLELMVPANQKMIRYVGSLLYYLTKRSYV